MVRKIVLRIPILVDMSFNPITSEYIIRRDDIIIHSDNDCNDAKFCRNVIFRIEKLFRHGRPHNIYHDGRLTIIIS